MKKSKKILLGILELSLVALLAYLFLSTVKSYKLPDDAVYYVNGTEYDIPSKTVISYDLQNNTTSIAFKDDDYDLEVMDLPLYFKNSETILLTSDITYVEPLFDRFYYYMCKPFSKVEYQSDILKSVFNYGKQSVEKQRGFFFDNNNTYIFIEKMNVTYNRKTITCGPLSYMIVDSGNWIQLYDTSTHKYTYEQLNDSSVVVKSVDDYYSINASSDIGYIGGKEYIIIASNELKEDFFEAFE